MRSEYKTIRLSERTNSALRDKAESMGISMSMLVRRILSDYLSGLIPTPPPREPNRSVYVRYTMGKAPERHVLAVEKAQKEGTSLPRVIEYALEILD